MNNDEILVSVVCDVYNHEPYLRQCFDGFVMQKTNFKFEVLVHDDASTDKSAEIIMEYTNKYPDIFKPIIQKENQYSKGVGIWKTYQFPRVKGKYVAFCEGDDYWIDSLKLQKQVNILESDASCTMVYSGFNTVNEEGTLLYRYDFDYNIKKSTSGFIFPLLLFRNIIMTVSCIVRKKVLSSEIYTKCSENLDYNLFLAAAFLGNCSYLKDATCAYRKVSSSMTNTKSSYVQQRFLTVWEYYVNSFYNIVSDKYSNLQKKETKITILARSIDLLLKGFGGKYIKEEYKKNDFCSCLIPACLYEIRYLLNYNVKKILRR